MTFLFSLFTALADLKILGDLFVSFASVLVNWYMQRQTAATLQAIADAAALGARAQTDDDRYQAAQAWQAALSHPRVLP